jgi:hypothetical protein
MNYNGALVTVYLDLPHCNSNHCSTSSVILMCNTENKGSEYTFCNKIVAFWEVTPHKMVEGLEVRRKMPL